MTEHSPHPVDWKNPCKFAMALAGAQASRTVILYLFWVLSAFKSGDNVSCARVALNIFSSCFNLLSIADRRSNGDIQFEIYDAYQLLTAHILKHVFMASVELYTSRRNVDQNDEILRVGELAE